MRKHAHRRASVLMLRFEQKKEKTNVSTCQLERQYACTHDEVAALARRNQIVTRAIDLCTDVLNEYKKLK